MALTAIGLCSRALLKLGATPITTFEDGTTEAEIASGLYAPTRDALLSWYAWSFATVQANLPRLTEAPTADHAYAFQLPEGFLRALSAGPGSTSRGLSYRIVGRTLQCNSTQVMLTYLTRPAEADFPGFFDLALIAKLTAEFCIPLTESTSRADMLTRLAEKEFERARRLDTQQDTQPVFEDFTLIEARR